MMVRILLIWFCLAIPASAAPVTVTSGEHDGFTRLVLDFGTPVDWHVGRTLDGYALQLRGASASPLQPYDLTHVFNLIGKSRLAAIWVDPKSAQLNIGIACACHAIPFEFRPGILVIDLRDGAPPKGSSFELASNGASVPTLSAKPAPRPRQRPQGFGTSYDWTSRALADLQAPSGPGPAFTSGFADPTLQTLRDSLLLNLSRGAAQGVVDLALPVIPKSPKNHEKGPATARIFLGALPGVAVASGLPDHELIAAAGQDCPTADQLSVSTWGTADPVASQMAGIAGLVTEFDKADPTALGTAIRFQLYLGFGIESRQMIRAFKPNLPNEATLVSLGYILDQETDPKPAFRGLAACDTPAAMWAVLSDPAPARGTKINVQAVLRTFSELPVHLRRHLGPSLAQRFLALDDTTTAMTIRNAITRAPGAAGPQIGLMEAAIAMSQDNPAEAEARLKTVLDDAGPEAPAALVALVNARVAQNLPVDRGLVTALESLSAKQFGAEQQSSIRRALLLAQAASGDFDRAFAGLPDSPDAAGDLWRILSKSGSDQAVLIHAVLPDEQANPQVDPETNAALATRLLDLGFADQALRWAEFAPSRDSVLAAQIHLARRDGPAALAVLKDSLNADAPLLRATALEMQGDNPEAAQIYAKISDKDAAGRMFTRTRDWQQIAVLSPEIWGPAVENLLPATDVSAPEPRTASLARGRQIAETAADTRSNIDNLLGKIAAP